MTTLETDWRQAAACSAEDPETFFPAKGRPAAPAKRICGSCPVRDVCLQDAIKAGYVHGVWGGLSAQERKALVVTRRRCAVDALVDVA